MLTFDATSDPLVKSLHVGLGLGLALGEVMYLKEHVMQ